MHIIKASQLTCLQVWSDGMETAEDHKEEDATDAGSFQGMCANTAQASNQYSQCGLGRSYAK